LAVSARIRPHTLGLLLVPLLASEPAACARGAGAAPLSLEPGLPLESAGYLLPVSCVDAGGEPVRLDAAGLHLTVGGAAVPEIRLEPFAPAAGGEAAAVAVLLAPVDLPARELEAWLRALGDYAGSGAGGALRGLYVAGEKLQILQRLGGPAPAAAVLGRAWDAAAPVRLWDCILQAMTRLSRGDLPARRVLVVLASGLESIESRHPEATCRQAAEAARIAVYTLALPVADPAAAGAGRARLAQLTRGSGGRLQVWEDPDRGRALRQLLAVVDGVQGIRFSAPDLELPAAVRLEAEMPEAAVAEGTLRARVALSGRRGLVWPLGLLLLLALILVLAMTARLKLSSLGELVLVGATGASYPVPSQGATIGSAADNTVVVADRRVSRRHALLKLRGKELLLTDLRSTNGTQVNGQTVRTATIRDGDHILLGGAVELIYRRQARRR